MGSCCVREKDQNPATQNLPPHIQVIRMQRRELLINHQQSKSIHQIAQLNGSSQNNDQQTDFETNNSTYLSPNAASKSKIQTCNTQASQPPTAEKQEQEKQQEQESQIVEQVEEEFQLNTEQKEQGQRQEQEKQSAVQLAPLINLQTLSSNNIISDSNIDGEEYNNLQNEKDISQIMEEDHEDSFSKQLTEQLRASLMNNNQFINSQHKSSGDSDFPMQNDISSISAYSQRATFPSKLSNYSRTIQFEKQSPYGSRPSSSNNLNINTNYSVSKSEAAFRNKSRNASPTNQDLITQKQEVFNFQKSDDLVKLQQEAWAIKEEQLKTELKRQETYKMEEELKKMDRRKMMKQFTQGLIGGTPFYRSSNNSSANTPMNFQSTQGIGSISCSTRSPCSSDHKTKPMRTNSTHFTQHSQSLRSSYVQSSAMPGSINIPTSIFENFRAKQINEMNGEVNNEE